MNEVFGFCISGGNDEPVDSQRFCLSHGALTIAPSWHKRGARWTGSGWEGDMGRPPGYVWKPRFSDDPAAAHTVETRPCGHCGEPFSAEVRGGSGTAYCGLVCKSRAANARRRSRNANLKQHAGARS
jgi:hypothetical protein